MGQSEPPDLFNHLVLFFVAVFFYDCGDPKTIEVNDLAKRFVPA